MLVTFAYALALLPVLSLAQTYPVTYGTVVTTITLPPFQTVTASAAASTTLVTSVVATSESASSSASGSATTKTTAPTTSVAVPAPTTLIKNGTATATATSTVNPFLGAASSMQGSGLAAALAGFAVLGMLYG